MKNMYRCLNASGEWYYFKVGELLIQAASQIESLSQCINLKDRNGIDVYQGDILQVFSTREEKDPYKWAIDKQFMTSCGCCAVVHGWRIRDYPENCIIVGNIFQNPELIESLQR